MIIHINGMPGVGKLTVAQILAQKLPARLIDNHRLIDAATTCCEHGSPAYVKVLHKITNIVFDELRTLPPGEIIIFTNALADQCPEDIARFDSCRQLAESRNEEFLAVLLTCSIESNIRRVSDSSRALKGKLVREERLLELLEQYSIYHPDTEKHKIEIDTTHLEPAESARIIQETAERLRTCPIIQDEGEQQTNEIIH
ncbi:MAG: AAA family ATPase [Candidatus Obscuribacterales bacterium]|nr:AAA family ATPase [Candidatus Obscuribacterales bacterium]